MQHDGTAAIYPDRCGGNGVGAGCAVLPTLLGSHTRPLLSDFRRRLRNLCRLPASSGPDQCPGIRTSLLPTAGPDVLANRSCSRGQEPKGTLDVDAHRATCLAVLGASILPVLVQ